MMAPIDIDRNTARARLDTFLVRAFGPDVTHSALGPVVVRDELTREHPGAFTFAVDTVRYLETGDIADRLMSGAIVVPKDGAPTHWAPTRWPVASYLSRVASGEIEWSAQ